MMNSRILVFLLLVVFFCNAQEVPTPAPPQQNRIALVGGTVHTGDGKVIAQAVVIFSGGIIEKISTTPQDIPAGTEIIDVTGQHVYPGLIAMNTMLGLVDIEAVRATRDMQETGSINPNAKAIVAYNTDSRVIPTIRTNGILYAQIMPQGGTLSGTAALVQLDAWNWEDAAVIAEEGILLNWPAMYHWKGWWAEPGGYEENKNYLSGLNDIKNYFVEAKSYQYTENEKKNLRFEQMKKIMEGKANLYIATNYVKEMLDAISFCEEMGIKPIFIGAKDAYQIAPLSAEKKIAVILNETTELPSYTDEDIQQPYKTPYILQQAGVQFAITNSGFWQVRNLPFQAGIAVGQGLSKEEALTAITLTPAKIMRIDTKIGSLAVGKQASIIVSKGDILDMKTSDISYAFIDGRKINLGNKQKDLAEKFSKKYNIELKK